MMEIRNLSVLAYANGFTLWHYKAGDNLDSVLDYGFFDGVVDMLAIGDMIMVSSSIGATVQVVLSTQAGVVIIGGMR